MLEKTPAPEKKHHIAIPLAMSFNSLKTEIAESYPDLKDHLPAPIEATLPIAHMGSADIKYLDLEIYTEQLIALLDIVERASTSV